LLAIENAEFTYLLLYFGVIRSASSKENSLSNKSYPGWYKKDSVTNPDRAFY